METINPIQLIVEIGVLLGVVGTLITSLSTARKTKSEIQLQKIDEAERIKRLAGELAQDMRDENIQLRKDIQEERDKSEACQLQHDKMIRLVSKVIRVVEFELKAPDTKIPECAACIERNKTTVDSLIGLLKDLKSLKEE